MVRDLERKGQLQKMLLEVEEKTANEMYDLTRSATKDDNGSTAHDHLP